MKLCRYVTNGGVQPGFYVDESIVDLGKAIDAFATATGADVASIELTDDTVSLCSLHGEMLGDAYRWSVANPDKIAPFLVDPTNSKLQVPVAMPNKLLLLAGNYSAHVEESGERAIERQETFPYVFMKPPTTTLRPPNSAIPLPAVSPSGIDYELELAVVMGREAKSVSESDAMDYVAGFTIINDLSDRRFRPNPQRRERDRDKFFDWLHGKWHDGFCPCGPCLVTCDEINDVQQLGMQLRVNGEIRQDASTALQVFSVAAVIEFVSSFVTLEPGDVISTGTPAGVGAPQGLFLAAGDDVEAEIESIGKLSTRIVAAN